MAFFAQEWCSQNGVSQGGDVETTWLTSIPKSNKACINKEMLKTKNFRILRLPSNPPKLVETANIAAWKIFENTTFALNISNSLVWGLKRYQQPCQTESASSRSLGRNLVATAPAPSLWNRGLSWLVPTRKKLQKISWALKDGETTVWKEKCFKPPEPNFDVFLWRDWATNCSITGF